jgi:hypothetical protein
MVVTFSQFLSMIDFNPVIRVVLPTLFAPVMSIFVAELKSWTDLPAKYFSSPIQLLSIIKEIPSIASLSY